MHEETFIQAMRQKLIALQAELQGMAATDDEAAAIVELDQSKVGRLSRMDAMQAQAMAQASIERREAMLREIAAALQRIDHGHYGLCRSCDEPIDPRRLEIDPTTVLCIDCANRTEA